MAFLGQPFYRDVTTVGMLAENGKLSPLSLSILHGNPIDDFSDPNDNDTGVPLFLAISKGNLDLVKRLVAAGADYESPPLVSIFTPVAHAILSNQTAISTYLKSLLGEKY